MRFFFMGLFLTLSLFAMDFEDITLSTWKRGESIAGEEFVAMDEAMVDYLKSLNHPTEPLKSIKYSCKAKTRLIRPDVINTPLGSNTEWTQIRSVYALKDCVEVKAE